MEVPELPGCMVDGKSEDEARANADICIQQWIRMAHELGRPVPATAGSSVQVLAATRPRVDH